MNIAMTIAILVAVAVAVVVLLIERKQSHTSFSAGGPAVKHLHQSLKAVTHFRARRAQDDWLAVVDRGDGVPEIVWNGPGDLQTQCPLHFLGVDVVPLARRSVHDHF